MEVKELLRVVTLRKGRLRPSEFKIREAERGLSLFAHLEHPSSTEVIEAVRTLGKQGDLFAAVVSAQEIRDMGLSLVQTAGETLVAEINAVHYEARLGWVPKLWLRLRGIPAHDYFNEHFSHHLCAIARVLG